MAQNRSQDPTPRARHSLAYPRLCIFIVFRSASPTDVWERRSHNGISLRCAVCVPWVDQTNFAQEITSINRLVRT